MNTPIPSARYLGPSLAALATHWFILLRPLTHDTMTMNGGPLVYPREAVVNVVTLYHLIPERLDMTTLTPGQVIESVAAVVPEAPVPVVGEIVELAARPVQVEEKTLLKTAN